MTLLLQQLPTIQQSVFTLKYLISTPLFLSDIDIDKFIADPVSLSRNCTRLPFADKDHGSIWTSDICIIKTYILGKIVCKGSKYRKSKDDDFTSAKSNVSEGTDKCIRL